MWQNVKWTIEKHAHEKATVGPMGAHEVRETHQCGEGFVFVGEQ